MAHRIRWTGAAVAVVLAAAVAVFANSAGSDAQGGTVNVSLTEWAVTPDVESVGEGDVTFTVTNDGTVPHELVIIRTDLPADALPLTEAGDRVPEAEVNLIGEVEEFGAGLTERGTFALTAGNYVLICNIPGHYTLGMNVAFTVTAAPAEEVAPTAEEPPAEEVAPTEEAVPVAVPAAGSGGLADGGSSVPLLAATLGASGVILVALITRRIQRRAH